MLSGDVFSDNFTESHIAKLSQQFFHIKTLVDVKWPGHFKSLDVCMENETDYSDQRENNISNSPDGKQTSNFHLQIAIVLCWNFRNMTIWQENHANTSEIQRHSDHVSLTENDDRALGSTWEYQCSSSPPHSQTQWCPRWRRESVAVCRRRATQSTARSFPQSTSCRGSQRSEDYLACTVAKFTVNDWEHKRRGGI